MTYQSYDPHRFGILSREQLSGLHRLQPRIVMRDTALAWLGILLAWVAVAHWPVWYVILPAIPVIGTRYYALFIIAHDGLHRRLFDRRRHNDLWNDLLIVAPLGAITRINRINHMRHHRELALPSDTDRYKYTNDDKDETFTFLFFLTGLQYVGRTLRNVLLTSKRGEHAELVAAVVEGEDLHYALRDVLLLAGWQLALIGGLTFAIGWWAYPLLWLLPVYCFAYTADIVRVFCEHSSMSDTAAADRTIRLVSFRSNWLERQFFAPHNMNFHAAHHLWPGIPYYNLPQADRLMRKSGKTQGIVWRSSYLLHLWRYLHWIRNGQPAQPLESL